MREPGVKKSSIAVMGRPTGWKVAVRYSEGLESGCANTDSQPTPCETTDNLDIQRGFEDNEGDPTAPPSWASAVPDPRVSETTHLAEGAKEGGIKHSEFLDADDVDAMCITQGENVLVGEERLPMFQVTRRTPLMQRSGRDVMSGAALSSRGAESPGGSCPE